MFHIQQLAKQFAQQRSLALLGVLLIHVLILFIFIHETNQRHLPGVTVPVYLNLQSAQEFVQEKHDTSTVKHAARFPKTTKPLIPVKPNPPLQLNNSLAPTTPQVTNPDQTNGKTEKQDSQTESSGGQPQRSVSISQLTILFSPNPSDYYPTISKKLEEEGKVQLRIFINERGLVENTEVIRSSQSSRLDAAAEKLARDTRFKPYAPEGTPIRISALLTVSFKLNH